MLDRYHTQEKVDLLRAIKARFGDEVLQIVKQVELERAAKDWQKLGEQSEDNSMEAFIRLLWGPLEEAGFVYTREDKEDGVQMICTKCPIHEMAKEMNATDLMYHLICVTDECTATAFNPQIGFKRTKTLMQGDEYCNHFYYMK